MPRALLIPLLLATAMAAASAYCWHGGTLHYEVEVRLPYYLCDRPLLSKIYDSDILDDGMYQARELSYFFDYIDSKFIAACVAIGHPHFLSLVQYVFLILISLVLWQFGVEDLKLSRWFVAGVLLLFWTAPAVFLSGSFFRTAKIGTALSIVILYRLLFRAVREPGVSWRLWRTCFGWAWVATLFDRQGVFMVWLIAVFLGFWWMGHRERKTLRLLGAFAAVLAICCLYNYVIAPLLTLSINNYWPDFKYQHLPWGDLVAYPWYFMSKALDLYLENVGYFLGNLPAWGAAVAIATLIWLAGRRGVNKRNFWGILGFILTQTVLTWGMVVLMFLRHAALLWPDMRRGGYLLPSVAMYAMTLLLVFSRLPPSPPRLRWLLPCLLGAAIFSNALALPWHWAVVIAGSQRRAFKAAPMQLEALRHAHDSHYVPPPEFASNRVWLFFHDGYFNRHPIFHSSKQSTPASR